MRYWPLKFDFEHTIAEILTSDVSLYERVGLAGGVVVYERVLMRNSHMLSQLVIPEELPVAELALVLRLFGHVQLVMPLQVAVPNKTLQNTCNSVLNICLTNIAWESPDLYNIGPFFY